MIMNKNLKFETALDKLSEVIEKLEDSETSLDEALKLYEEGISLIRFCTQKLDDAEQKIKLLQKSGDTLSETEYSGDTL